MFATWPRSTSSFTAAYTPMIPPASTNSAPRVYVLVRCGLNDVSLNFEFCVQSS